MDVNASSAINRHWLRLLIVIWAMLICRVHLFADEITVLDDAGKHVAIEARWVAEGKEAVALERRDGRWEVVPGKQIIKRVPKDGPAPLTPQEVEQRLRKEFDDARLVSLTEAPFVIVLIATQAVDKKSSKRWEQQLKRAMKFLQGMQTGFLDFAEDAELELHELRFPLVVLIFESDQEFNGYVTAQTEGTGLSAEKIASFYDFLTNRLALRVRECKTFVTPLHEAIHQQAHNRGVLTRLAPVPAWFNEGLATGFEGDGEKLKSGPKAMNRKYAGIALNAKKTSWTDIVREDTAFQGDILAGEAYAQAWGMHWWLYTRHRPEYRKLLQHYSALEPLTTVSAEERLQTFADIVGQSPEELQQAFAQEVGKSLKRK